MHLTPRQRQVVILLSEGLSCVQISKRMGVAVQTVRAHVRDIAKLLGPDGDVPALRRIKRNAKQLLAA